MAGARRLSQVGESAINIRDATTAPIRDERRFGFVVNLLGYGSIRTQRANLGATDNDAPAAIS